MNGAADDHPHPDSTKRLCHSRPADPGARRQPAGRDVQIGSGGDSPGARRIRRLAGRQPTLWPSALCWRAHRAPSCSWHVPSRRSHSPAFRSNHARPGSSTAITASSCARTRMQCSPKRVQRCLLASRSRSSRSDASPRHGDCVSWRSQRPPMYSFSAQPIEGGSGGCCIPASFALCCETHHAPSPSCRAILAIAPDRCLPSRKARATAANGRPAPYPIQPGTFGEEGSDPWPRTANTCLETSRAGRPPEVAGGSSRSRAREQSSPSAHTAATRSSGSSQTTQQ